MYCTHVSVYQSHSHSLNVSMEMAHLTERLSSEPILSISVNCVNLTVAVMETGMETVCVKAP